MPMFQPSVSGGSSGVTASGLTLTVPAFSVGGFAFAGGTVTALPGLTQYVGVNTRTGKMHCLPRAIDSGTVFVAKVVAGASAVTSIQQIQPEYRTTLSRVHQIMRNIRPMRMSIVGSSLLEYAHIDDSLYRWGNLLMIPTSQSYGYSVLSDGAQGASSVTVTNGAVGGTQACYGFAVVAGSCYAMPATTQYPNMAGELTMASLKGSNLAQAPGGEAQSLLLNADVLIMGAIANGGDGRASFWEPMIAAARRAGCDVIVATDNASSPTAGDPTTWTGWPEGDQIASIARKYGCAVADTAAYMAEGYLRGWNAYVDVIHCTTGTPAGASNYVPATGHEIWAEVMSAILHCERATVDVPAIPRFTAYDNTQAGMVRLVVSDDVQVSGSSTWNSEAAGIGTNGSPGQVYNVASTKRRRDVPSGASFFVAHPMMIRAQIIYQGGSDFSFDVYTNGGTIKINTVSSTGEGPSSKVLDIATPTMLGGVGALPINQGLKCVVTSGTVRILALAVHTPLYRDVINDVQYYGTWATENTAFPNMPQKYSDTANSWCVLETDCKSARIGFAKRPNGGTTNLRGDNRNATVKSMAGSLETEYVAWNFPAYGRHIASCTLVTAGAAPSAADRSVGVIAAYAVEDR